MKKVLLHILVGVLFVGSMNILSAQEELSLDKNPLAPVKTDNPRDTMQSFMTAMNKYKQGVETNDDHLQAQINVAVRCLDLSSLATLVRHEKGVEAAIMLKEVIDRVIVIDYEKIPEEPTQRWRLRHTEIVINRIESGDRAGEFLFSAQTVERVPEFYAKVKNLPYLPKSGHGAGYKTPWLERYVPHWAKSQVFLLETWQWIGLAILILLGLVIKTLVRHSLGLIKLFVSKANVQFITGLLQASLGPTGYIIAALFWFVSLRLLKFEGETSAFFKCKYYMVGLPYHRSSNRIFYENGC